MYTVVDPLPCGEITRAAFNGVSWLKYAATFQGRQDFEVLQDFKEMWYYVHVDDEELESILW